MSAPADTAAAQVDFPTPYLVYGEALGDIDGDGRLDLASTGTTTVTGRLGQPDGSFGVLVSTPSAPDPEEPHLGDLDGDGRDDVVYLSEDDDVLAIVAQLSTGGGAFGAPQTVPLPAGTYGWNDLDVLDVDGDGRLDLALGRFEDSRITVYPGAGDGSFGPPGYVLAVKNTIDVAAGDLNGDGRVDLVALGATGGLGEYGTIGVLLGRAGGGFAMPLEVADQLIGLGVRLLVADLNGDARDDIVTMGAGFPLLFPWVPHSGGTGAPTPLHADEFAGSMSAAAAADLDDDARTDLVMLNDEGILYVLLQADDGSLQAPRRYGVRPSGLAGLIGFTDRDEDGDLDILASVGGTITLLRRRGEGGFEPAYGFEAQALDLDAADLDLDGHVDVVVVNGDGQPAQVLAGFPTGGFGPPAAVEAGPKPTRVVAGRYTGDDRPDLFVVHENAFAPALAVVPGVPLGGFGLPILTVLPDFFRYAATGDLDGDGIGDALVRDPIGDTLHVLLNDGQGQLVDTGTIGITHSIQQIALADLDADGALDLVIARTSGGGVTFTELDVRLGNGDGSFAAPLVQVVHNGPLFSFSNLDFGDFDADGHIDLVGYAGFQLTAVLPGNGDGSFGPYRGTFGEIYDSLRVADIDRDGWLDLVGAAASGGGSPPLHVQLGLGGLGFGPAHDIALPGGIRAIDVADLDADGAPDLALAMVTGRQVLTLANGDGPWQDLGQSLQDGQGYSKLAGLGTLQAGAPTTLLVSHGPPAAPAIVIAGWSTVSLPFKGGVLVPAPQVTVGGLATDAKGALALSDSWPAGLAADTTLYLQVWFADAATPSGAAATNALSATTP